MKKIAIVTGAARGLGKALALKLAENNVFVILAVRSVEKAVPVLEEIVKNGGEGVIKQCDISEIASIEKFAADIAKEYSHIDIVLNCAAISIDNGATIENLPYETVEKTMATNFYGTLWMCKMLLPLLRKSADARVVNFSSGLGQLTVPRMGENPSYSMSKTIVNAITKIMADEEKDTNIIVTSVDPGWVLTDMGGPNAMLTIAEGIDTPFWLATTDAKNLVSGEMYKERQILGW
ncbi:MAG: SDR family NAD(P)-dependent oxidoreductase [Bacteroidales bacterium]|jgi:NAD(P)-dependent dehydrogenase (short-subunit alcohol dehydrogenase family)|nr:SDR family NAD(P)-dependent oxidoreductase [Bacteroidales bacterium]